MSLPTHMHAVELIGHGDLDQLVYRTDRAVPVPAADQVLIQVGACGVNNTDINTRIGWYSKSVSAATDAAVNALSDDADATWSGQALSLPRIQGADVCGRIVDTGADVGDDLIGQRVIARTMMADPDGVPNVCWTMGSECDGGFAQFVVVRASEVYAVDSAWSDAELASIPCAYSTAENMLERANLGAERVLITGASGGVGSAAVQLAKRRGATVTAVAGLSKHADLQALGADVVHDRQAGYTALPESSFDLVVDVVGGDDWPNLLPLIRVAGRYISAGAIAGPVVDLDLRTLYLKDLTLMGSTFQPHQVFKNLIGYIERNEIKPLVARTYPLADIHQAQRDFMAKGFTGKLVLIPPEVAVV